VTSVHPPFLVAGARAIACAVVLFGWISAALAGFTTFESGQVRPLALSPDGTRLFAVNTPDACLEVFAVGGGGLVHLDSVPVGLEPVAVAARSDAEVWVVNHLSDSVSVVDVAADPPRVVRTLLVGDEPRDIVFAGPGRTRAFVTAAHRGQNTGFDPALTTAGIGRADVWVFDATNLGASLGGTPLTRLALFGDTPRALAASPDGATVYAAVFLSGNRTTTIPEPLICNGGASVPPCELVGQTMAGGLPAPNTNFAGVPGPETGLIVGYDAGTASWRDELGRDWSNLVRFDLPDRDVFAIAAGADPPVATGSFASVGTVVFNLAVNPVSGVVYASNTDANNRQRFEGPGIFAGSSLRGHLAEARITVLDGATVTPRRLNPHIDYDVVPSPPGVKDASLATPLGMAVTADGATLWVAAFGSGAVARIDTSALENGTFAASAADHTMLTGGGPTGIALDEANGVLYVLTRFDNAVSVIDLTSRLEIAHVALHNPEPASVLAGRRFLYDAAYTSSNGEASCASCHIFGDLDALAWDLGNPDDVVRSNLNPIIVDGPPGATGKNFHPLKGPMTTQSLRGMAGAGPMHWRGDRTGSHDPGGSAFDEIAAFAQFNPAFDSLLGRGSTLTAEEMEAFTAFILQVTYPPNPIRRLDDTLTADQQAGRDFFTGPISDSAERCDGCHVLDRAAGFFGTAGMTSFEAEPQFFKVAHLRNLYQKVGMFGLPIVPGINPGDNGHKGEQIRGFGFLHDGSVDTPFRFVNAFVFNASPFNPTGFPSGAAGDPLRRQVESFLFAFDSNLDPLVGQQITRTSTNGAQVGARIDLLVARAAEGACELVAKGVVNGEARGWLLQGSAFQSDRADEPALSDATLRQLATSPGQAITYLCVPAGSGQRAGLDRDDDGFYDRDELDAGTDPADPASSPGANQLLNGTKLLITNRVPDDESRNRITLVAKDATITAPVPGSASDPRCGDDPPGTVKATLVIESATSGHAHTTALPCQHWSLNGSAAHLKGYRYKDNALTDGTVHIVTWQKGKQLKVLLSGKGPSALDYDLETGVDEDTIEARLTSGGSIMTVRCAPVPGKDGSDGARFQANVVTCTAP
jgi:YVTN family beta-propeller protein